MSMTETKEIETRQFIGTDADGVWWYVRIRTAEVSREVHFTDHTHGVLRHTLLIGFDTARSWDHSGPGLDGFEVAEGWTREDIATLQMFAQRWDRNGLRAGSDWHIERGMTYETHPEAVDPSGYRIGSEWLAEQLPDAVLTEIARIRTLPTGPKSELDVWMRKNRITFTVAKRLDDAQFTGSDGTPFGENHPRYTLHLSRRDSSDVNERGHVWRAFEFTDSVEQTSLAEVDTTEVFRLYLEGTRNIDVPFDDWLGEFYNEDDILDMTYRERQVQRKVFNSLHRTRARLIEVLGNELYAEALELLDK